ncbi:MAG TPA: hypothetical protein VGQ44_08910 [Gemmatimonadaceae bacterium]|jgi:hypothetical protein|nr:hypothetical protein [Gemmatimonadaceae bacterium]
MDDSLDRIAVNDNQRRHFEVLLSRLEDSLGTIETLLAAPRARNLSRVEDDVPSGFRTIAASEIPAIKHQIERLAVAMNLRPSIVSLRRVISASLTTDVIRIEDSLSSGLRGYGVVDPTLPDLLDPALLRLAHSLGRLASALKR